MKKYSIGFILIEIAVMLVISCIPTIFVLLYTDPEKNLTIPAFIVFLFLAFILHTSLANRILFPIAKKTMENRSEKEGFVISDTFYNRQSNSCASVLSIDEVHGKIAYVSVHNPFEFQTADVNDLTDARSGYIKGPFDGTRYVYYQFVYKNKRMRIPTFTAKNMHLLSATIVKDAISKAECFSDSVQKLQKKSMKTERRSPVFLTDQEIEKVLNTINGKAPEDEVLKDMKVFFRKTFSVEILDYITDRLKEGRLRVTFMVWGTESALPFICDNERVYENKIREQFSRTCAKHELNKDYYNPSDYFAVVSDFKPDVEQRLMSRENTKKITGILKKYPEVKRHHFTGPTIFVFYSTDKDIAANRESGLTQRIYDEIQTVFDNAAGMSGIKLGDVRFSSLETFEGKYGGNFHGFWLDH